MTGRTPIISVALVLVSLLSTSPPAASVETDDARQGFVQSARAVWRVGDARFEARGLRVTEPGAEGTIGTVATLQCGTKSPCIGAAATKRLKPDAFIFDPSLGSAELQMRFGGDLHDVTWSGEGAPEFGVEDPTAPSTVRSADAEGTIFSTDFEGDTDPDEAAIEQGYESGEDASGSEDPPDPPGIESAGGLFSNTNSCIAYKASEKAFARKINEERKKHGKKRLRLDTELGKVARRHTAEMVDRDLLHHTSTSALTSRVTRWRLLGENVGVGGTVSSLHQAFMASPPHRANVLHPKYRHVGVGVTVVGVKMWVTIIFEARRDPGTTLNCK